MDAATWALALTAPRAENRVCRGLSLRNIPYQLFLMKRKFPFHGRMITRLEAAFSRYVFVFIHEPWVWYRTREVDGWLRWVPGADGMPARVPAALIEHLQSRVDAEGVLDVPEEAGFQPGDRVRVKGERSQVFGAYGQYVHATRPGKAWVLLPWFDGQMVGTEIDLSDLEKDTGNERRKLRRGGRRRGRTRYIRRESHVNPQTMH